MNRRSFLLSASVGALATAAGTGLASAKKMLMPWEWTDKHGLANNMRKDASPLENEFEKYPRCPYCGMARKMWSHTRHLIQYEDDSTEGTCSVHCAAISLALNMDRGPKHIWVGDAGSDAKIKPLIEVDKANYALEQGKMGTMTGNRKWAYADKAKADATGGKVVGFDEALQAAYVDMGKNTIGIRKRRAEKRAHMAKKMKMMKGK
jgi:nitrous oxide reductase accessory protein NosL